MLADRNFGDWHTLVGEVPWSSAANTKLDCHNKLVPASASRHASAETDHVRISRSLWPTRRAAAFWTCCNLSMTFFGAEDKTELQESTRDVTKAWTNVFTDLMSSERWTRLSCQSQKKHVLQAFETCLSSTAIWVVSSLHKIRNEIRHRTGLRILGLTETAGI